MPYILYIIAYLIVFYMGMAVFSYLNLVVERLPKKESVLIRYTSCPDCGHVQTVWDVIPIFSRIRYQNRCRYCGTKLAAKPLVIECIGGALAVLSFAANGIHIAAIWYFIVACDLFLIAMFDMQTHDIPIQFIIALLILGIPAVFLFPEITVTERLIGLMAVSVPMFIIARFTGWFGVCDIAMMCASGLLLGWKGNVFAFLAGMLISGGCVWYMHIRRTMDSRKSNRKKSRKSSKKSKNSRKKSMKSGSKKNSKDRTKTRGNDKHVSFAPCLAVGIIIAMTHSLGDALISLLVG